MCESLKNFRGSLLAVFPFITSGGAHLVINSREPQFDQFKHSHPIFSKIQDGTGSWLVGEGKVGFDSVGFDSVM